MTTKAELACVYSALLLVDDDVAVTVSISSLLESFDFEILLFSVQYSFFSKKFCTLNFIFFVLFNY